MTTAHSTGSRPGSPSGGTGSPKTKLAAFSRVQRHHAAVDVGAEAAVEAHLVVAPRAPPVERREVEKAEVDRLLDLDDVVARERDERDVRLHERHVVGQVAVRARERGKRGRVGEEGLQRVEGRHGEGDG